MPFTLTENVQGLGYFVPSIIFQVIAFLTVVLRVWSNRDKKLPLQIGDYSILAALILSIAATVLFGFCIRFGLGVHIGQLDINDIRNYVKIQSALTVIWGFALLAIRISIVRTYILIFRGGWLIKACYVWLAFETGWALQNAVGVVLICRPLEYEFDKTIPGGHCVDIEAYYYATHIIIFTLDAILTILPMPTLWRLQMHTKKKLTVTVMLGLGILINIINLIRIAWRNKVASPDKTYEYALLLFFTVLEIYLGIVLASLPFLQPVLARLTGLYMFCPGRHVSKQSLGSKESKTGGKSIHVMQTFNTESTSHLKLTHEWERGYIGGENEDARNLELGSRV
ncbi:hypothetical protein F4678DRAFT_436200 [Xylaria arbuscula]|nr:hypothetical protein F4678DRAFT_436200 [Xylaria arbuscula]